LVYFEEKRIITSMSSLPTHIEQSEDAPSFRTLREAIQFYMIDFQTPLGKAIDIFIILLNLLVVALFIIQTYPISLSLRLFLWRVEVAAIGLFIIEYILRFYGAPDRWAYVKDIYSIIDLVAILPTLLLLAIPISGAYADIRFIQILRVFAVFRIFRFLRFTGREHRLFGIISLEMLNVARLVITIIMIFFVSSGFFYYVESPVNPQVQNFGDAFYFTVVAVSTVGFGDIVPISEWGRLVTIMMIISGIILIPIEAGRIFREWISVCERKTAVCPNCNLERHDADARYCKRCGGELYQK
jgi:voltage-gated potassium channel